jgi:AraC family transcriptional regulator of adaptative response/methylated-DNA-[protein]-cysteine methyltransferase
MKDRIMDAITMQTDTRVEDIGFGFGLFSLGTVLVAANNKGIAAILMGNDQTALTRELTNAFPDARLAADQAGLEDMTAKVVAFLDAPHKGLELPLDIRGNALEQAVWQALRAVPSGETITYGQIAKALPVSATAQEVGAACAAMSSRSLSLATAWSRRTARSRATAGACSASAS